LGDVWLHIKEKAWLRKKSRIAEWEVKQEYEGVLHRDVKRRRMKDSAKDNTI
jgi:hypothetical protein